jgi:hypothetical protein
MSKKKIKKEAEKAVKADATKVGGKVVAASVARIDVKAEPSKPAEPVKLELAAMSAEFCIQDQKYWEGKDDIFNPSSNECSSCAKDYPNQPALCAARTAYLVSLSGGKKSKTKSERTPKTKVPKDGRLPQSAQIDAYIRNGSPIIDMVTTLAARDFGNDLKQANTRIISHLKAIVTGRYCRSAEMKPLIEYLSADEAKAIGLVKAAAAA